MTNPVPDDRPPLSYPAGREIADDRMMSYGTKNVYCHLAGRLYFGSHSLVKLEVTAARLGMDVDTVRLALRRLVNDGYIEVERAGDTRAKSYRLVWQRKADAA